MVALPCMHSVASPQGEQDSNWVILFQTILKLLYL